MADLLRRDALAAAIQHEPEPITTQIAAHLNAAAGFSPHRNTARKDLRALVARGVLFPRLAGGRHTYTRMETPVPDPNMAPALGAPAASDFFQAGHDYTHRDGSDFLTVTITTHPNTGEPRALGWIVRNGWHEPAALDPDDWTQYDGYEPPAEGEAARD